MAGGGLILLCRAVCKRLQKRRPKNHGFGKNTGLPTFLIRVKTFMLCFCYVLLCFCYVLLCFVMFSYVFLCFAMFSYVLPCFCYALLCFPMFCYVCYVLLCFAIFCYFFLKTPHCTGRSFFLSLASRFSGKVHL